MSAISSLLWSHDLSFFSDPTSPPGNVRAMAESPTTIAVMWEEVPPIDQNGVITMYEVMYTPLETFGGALESVTVTVLEPERSVDLIGLQEFVFYDISIRAFTNEGPGPSSDAVTILTDEDGETCILYDTWTLISALLEYN